jgi:hypothetical protein
MKSDIQNTCDIDQPIDCLVSETNAYASGSESGSGSGSGSAPSLSSSLSSVSSSLSSLSGVDPIVSSSSPASFVCPICFICIAESVRVEHLDYHFACEVQQQIRKQDQQQRQAQQQKQQQQKNNPFKQKQTPAANKNKRKRTSTGATKSTHTHQTNIETQLDAFFKPKQTKSSNS